MQIGQPSDQPAVHFFGEWRALARRAQACFEMGEIDARQVRCQSAGERAGGVSLDQDQIGRAFDHHAMTGRQKGGEEIDGFLIRAHDIEVDIGSKPELGEHRAQHVAMLARRAERDLEPGRMRPQGMYDRHHLDAIRTGREHDHHMPSHRWPPGRQPATIGHDNLRQARTSRGRRLRWRSADHRTARQLRRRFSSR